MLASVLRGMIVALTIMTTVVRGATTDGAHAPQDFAQVEGCAASDTTLLQTEYKHIPRQYKSLFHDGMRPGDANTSFSDVPEFDSDLEKEGYAERVKALRSSAEEVVPLKPLVIWTSINIAGLCILVMLGRRSVLATRDAKPRDASLDRAKWVLSSMVCFGHMIQYKNIHVGGYKPWDLYVGGINYGLNGTFSRIWSHPCMQMYTFEHMFMMPAFCFLSGHFSRSYVKHRYCGDNETVEISVVKQKLQSTVTQILLVAFVASILCHRVIPALESLSNASPQPPWSFLLSRQLHLAWYLVALFMWRMFLPLWSCLRLPITCSLVLACAPMAFEWRSMILARTLGYFPFFVCGWAISTESLDHFRKTTHYQFGGLVLLVGLAFLTTLEASMEILTDIVGHPGNFGASPKLGWAIPFAYYPSTLLCVGAFICAWQPMFALDWGAVLDGMSTRSLYNYLFHSSIASAACLIWDWVGYMNILTPYGQVLATLNVSISILVFLTSWPVYYILSSICEPKLTCIFSSRQDVDTRTDK